MVGTCTEKERGRCSNKRMELGSEWTPNDRKTKIELKRCYKYKNSQEYRQKKCKSEDWKTSRMKTRYPIGKRAKKKNYKQLKSTGKNQPTCDVLWRPVQMESGVLNLKRGVIELRG